MVDKGKEREVEELEDNERNMKESKKRRMEGKGGGRGKTQRWWEEARKRLS